MPTSHVMPESAERLQEIADALWKAKKVLVVTGAGISTNSGIPVRVYALAQALLCHPWPTDPCRTSAPNMASTR